MCEVSLLPVSSLCDQEADILISILNDDIELKTWLNSHEVPRINREEFRQKGEAWQEQHNAVSYCIFTQAPVGEISISHRTADGNARIGYWIASSEWGKGIGTQAFKMALEIAREMGITQLSARIQSHNLASRKIWRRFGAVEEDLGNNRLLVRLDLHSIGNL